MKLHLKNGNIFPFSLNQLAEAANRESNLGDDAFVRGLQHYKSCGDYLIAAKAKGKAEIGTSFRWSEWLKNNWNKSHSLAARFMRLSESWEKLKGTSNFHESVGYDSALKLLSVQPDTIDVEVIEKEIIKTEIKEIVKKIDNPKLTKQLQSGEVIRRRIEKESLEKDNTIADLTKQLTNLTKQLSTIKPQQITVIDDSDRIRADKAEQQLKIVQEQIFQMATARPQISLAYRLYLN